MASSGMVEREGRHEGQLQQGRGEEGFAQFGQFAGLVKFKLYYISPTNFFIIYLLFICIYTGCPKPVL